MKSKIFKSIVSIVLVMTMIFSMLTASLSTASAGILINLVKGEFTAIAFELFERSAITAIGKAQNRTDNETTAEVLSWTKRILGGYQGTVNSELLSRTQEINEDLDELYTVSVENFNEINDKLNQISSELKKQEFEEKRAAVQTFSDSYKQILNKYNNLYDAFYKYGTEPTKQNKDNLQQCYLEIYNNYYYSPEKENELFISPMMDKAVERYGFLNTISSYDNSYTLKDQSGEYLDISNPDNWGNKESRETYLGLMRAYVESEYNFENNVYDIMVSGAQEVGIALSLYTQAYRAYVDFNTVLINSDPNLTTYEKDSQTKMLNSHFEEYSLKGIRAVNQMYYEQEDVFTNYMRSYDTGAYISLDNYKAEATLSDAYANQSGADISSDETIYGSSHALSTFGVYQFKLVNETDNTMYAIKSNSKEFTILDSIEKDTPEYGNYCFSLDTLNLLNSTSSPQGLDCIKSVSELSPIMSAGNTAYINSNSNIINNIISELSVSHKEGVDLTPAQVISDTNDDTKEGNFLLLNTPISWSPNAVIGSDDAEMKWANISMSIPTEMTIDAEKDTAGKHSEPLYVMYKGSPKVNVDVNSTTYFVHSGIRADGEVDVYVDGESIFANGKNGENLTSSKAMTIKAKPNEDCIITRVVLKNSYGETIEEVYGDDPASKKIDTYALEAQPLMDYMHKDENGYYEFVVPVPCQDVTVEVNFEMKDESLEKYSVTLDDMIENNESIGQMYFESYNGMLKKNFLPGEEVSICVIPNDPKNVLGEWSTANTICEGIEVVDSNGNSIAVKDATDLFYKIKPTERRYTFTMPDSDVTVNAKTGNGNIVLVDYATDHCSHYFTNLNCYNFDFATSSNNESWSKSKNVVFKTGDMVSLKPVADTGYCITEVNVATESGDVATSVKSDGTITFEMPDENVTVMVFAESDTDSNYTAKITSNGANSISFVDSAYNNLNTVNRYYKSGDTVYFAVDENDATATLKATNSANSEDIKNVTLEKVLTQDSKNIYKFTMPSYNVTVDVYVKPSLVTKTTEISITKGKTEKVSVEVVPNSIANKEVVWESDNESVATVDNNGLITAVDLGTAVITARLKTDSEIFTQINVTVDDLVPDENGNYIIESYSELCSMREYINSGDSKYTSATYILGKDIVCPAETSWAPITAKFSGTLDGNNHTISSLSITSLVNDKTGFFLETGESGVVKNLNFENLSIDIDDNQNRPVYIGGIISENSGTISNCNVSGEIIYNQTSVSDNNGASIGTFAAYNDNTIKDCVSNCSITAQGCNSVNMIGGIVGFNYRTSTIENCTNNGKIKSKSITNIAGGIVGFGGGYIKHSANTGSIAINGPGYVGGICGCDFNASSELAKISNCYNKGSILITPFETDDDSYQALYDEMVKDNPIAKVSFGGGVMGYSPDVKISNSFNVGAIIVNGTERHNLFGFIDDNSGIVNSYYLVPNSDSDKKTGAKSMDKFTSGEVAYLLNSGVTDSTQVWYQNIDNGVKIDLIPTFESNGLNTVYKVDQIDKTYSNNKDYITPLSKDENGNFIISSYNDLLTMAKWVNSGNEEYANGSYVLANNITCEGEWITPIGLEESPFTGTFDGQNYAISGLNATKTSGSLMGLFGNIKDATVKNLHLENVDFDIVTDSYSPAFDGPDANVGALCGQSTSNSTITNCTVSGSIKAQGALYVAGLCGYVTSTKINKCITNCTVSSDSKYIGGLIASANRDVTINNCANTNSVTANGAHWCGGLVGLSSYSDIKNCYNTGTVSGTMTPIGTKTYIGTITGSSENVLNCYYLDTSGTDSYATAKTIEQFNSGEVAYLLNKTYSISDWTWFQNIDNGNTPDEFPTLNFTRNNVVLKVNREDKIYSNIPNGYLPGDTDLNGDVNIMDATIVQMHCAKLYELTGSALVNADVVKDNVISISDATLIQAYIAGIVPNL
ncbi:MAG: Ig-like domain-containing protein [Ruminococcus sp.]|nr:Ig-like domain-containing protein [Ruminococcus sp.]